MIPSRVALLLLAGLLVLAAVPPAVSVTHASPMDQQRFYIACGSATDRAPLDFLQVLDEDGPGLAALATLEHEGWS